MAEYNKKSLINIAVDEYEELKGTITRNNSNISLSPNSACRFKFEYLFAKDNLKTSSLLISYSVHSSEQGIISRHNPNVKVNLHIRYYKEDNSGTVTSYIPGPVSSYQLYPYYNTEKDGFISKANLNIENTLVKYLYVDLINDGASEVVFNGLSIYKEQTTSEIVQDALGGLSLNEIIKSVDTYNNGFVVYYVDKENPATLRVSDGEAEGVYKVNVSDVYEFSVVVHSGQMPYIGSDTQ